MIAVRDMPQLTPFGIGVHYSYYRLSKEAMALEIRNSRLNYSPNTHCGWWPPLPIGSKRTAKTLTPTAVPFSTATKVEQYRRCGGDPDPYIHNGAFIAAAVGLGYNWKINGPNCFFRHPTLRQRINRELCGYGQRLRGNSIVQEFTEGPLMLPCSPRVIERDVDLHALARELGVL